MASPALVPSQQTAQHPATMKYLLLSDLTATYTIRESWTQRKTHETGKGEEKSEREPAGQVSRPYATSIRGDGRLAALRRRESRERLALLLLAFWPFFDFCLSSASHGRTRVSRCETDKRAQRRELGGNVTQAGLVASERPTGVLVVVVVRQTRPTSDLNEGPARTEKGRTNDEQRAG
ncbi:hypothetical protein TEQG_04314 [Trichophyton equinum CBS 127.97]|uniref:Uncharacterized protein n=1 Tax=Trichophyton equinum (strain ATCC MYA-4606 / CBS 127.97) TaxID=559882 RepID=F2PU70_TRIEC|nr:hypothetical protein TEQG_04314 [Trichophyton equinum CBS 127.97]